MVFLGLGHTRCYRRPYFAKLGIFNRHLNEIGMQLAQYEPTTALLAHTARWRAAHPHIQPLAPSAAGNTSMYFKAGVQRDRGCEHEPASVPQKAGIASVRALGRMGENNPGEVGIRAHRGGNDLAYA